MNKEIWKDIAYIGRFLGPPIVVSWIVRGVHVAGRVVTVKASVIATLVLVIVWLIWFLIRVAPRMAFSQPSFPSKPRPKALSGPEALVEMEEKLSRAIAFVKKVPVEKRGPLKLLGVSPLYHVPWYLVIGPQGGGKTTLLKHSGVQFMADPPLETTPNCDWFLANQAIILDTSGRYVTFSHEESNRNEWLGLLTLLKKYRKKKPINGAVVVIDLNGMLSKTKEQNEQEARILRERLDELVEKLDLNFPVYLVFTKCDRLYGFTPFFSDLTTVEAGAQVWGCTFTEQQESPGEAFAVECQKLYQLLNEKKMARLASETDVNKKMDLEKNRALYLFPLEFHHAFQVLKEWVEILFRFTAYHDEKPMFRGFYFTSGTQEGEPIARVLQQVADEFNINPRILMESSPEKKPYFIRDLWTKIIFGDRSLARRTAKAERRFWLKRLALATVAFVMSIAIILFGDGSGEEEMTAFIHANRPIESVRVDDRPVDERKIIKKSDNQWIIPLSGGKPHKIRIRTSEGRGYPPKTVMITYNGQVVNFP